MSQVKALSIPEHTKQGGGVWGRIIIYTKSQIIAHSISLTQRGRDIIDQSIMIYNII